MLQDAIEQSTSIKELHLDGVGEEALSVLTRMRSPLESVDLFVEPSAVEFYPDPTVVLSGFASSLTHLRVRWVQMDRPSIQFPKVQSLSIEDDNFVPADLLIHVFPNLRSLTISTDTGEHLEMEQADLKQIHYRNKNHQKKHGSWPVLDYLEGDVTLLYCLAPTCKVRRLSVWASSSDVDKLLVLCKEIQPESLKLYFHMNKLSMDELEEVLKSGDIKHISLTIDTYSTQASLEETQKYFVSRPLRFHPRLLTLTGLPLSLGALPRPL